MIRMKSKYLYGIGILIILLSSQSIGQTVWFDWLDHIKKVQDEWINIETETFSIWNNLTRFQDFGKLRDRTTSLWNSVRIMEKVHDRDKQKYGIQYKEFFSLSSKYLSALEQTVLQLEHILSELYKKSQNAFYYSWEEYQKDINAYNALVDNYHNLGNEMNLAFNRVK